VTGDAFKHYLENLKIEVFDASFGDPGGQGASIGSTGPNQIIQHTDPAPINPALKAVAVASAMIVLNEPVSPLHEYSEPDVRIRVVRDGKTVRKLATEYNVAVVASQDVASFDPTTVDPARVAAYVELPDPGLAFDAKDAVVDLQKDGTPPNFADLMAAVETVLNQDPGNTQKLGSLSVAECRHIAREIAWNRHVDPIPFASKQAFEKMYTVKSGVDLLAPDVDTNAQKEFQGALAQYHAVHDADAEALTKYIFALSAAVACENKSAASARSGLSFPIQPGVGPTGKAEEAEVVLEH
jgi:hypothetical protein